MLKKAWGKLKSVTGKNLDRFRGRQAIRGGLFKEIDLEALKELGKKHEGHPTQKYQTRFEHSLVRNAERLFRLQLHKTKGRRILDLGCGFGYFMYGAKKLGHFPVGLDVPDPYLSQVTSLLGLEKVVHRIEPFQPLPVIEGGPFDLITGFAIMFDHAAEEGQWGIKEWKYFLGDLKRYMAPDCLLHFKFNQYVGPGCKTGIGCRAVPDELREYFQSIGGKFDKRTMQIANARAQIG
jgi:cyclopropane fatty-acyl-phospholipid synthase-like methyltransferase